MNIQAQETKNMSSRKSNQAQELATLTRALSHCCLDKEEKICQSFGLHAADGRVLAAMQRDNVATPSEVAEHLGIGHSRVTPLIDRLAKKGLVLRTESGQDRRVKQLILTEDGRAIAKRLQEFEIELHQNLLGHFQPAKRRFLLDSLHELQAAMESVRRSIKP